MSRWFRHYAGMCRDDKLVRVALRAKQPIERVVWIYAAILESAAEVNDNGRYDFDIGEASYFLRADEDDVRRVVDALADMERLCEGSVAKWGERQFKSDTSAERQRNYRDRKRASDHNNGDGAVTSPARHGDAPEADTKTDTEAEQKTRAPAKSSLEQECRSLVGEEPVLLALDFHVLERLVEGGDVTPDDVKAGIRAAMERPNFRIRHWSQLEGWARGAAKDRLAGKSKATVNGHKSSVTPEKKIWLPQGSAGYEAWRTAFPGTVKAMLTSKGSEQGILMASEFPPASGAAA